MGRTIFIGDVHGCADELDDLFDRVALVSGDRVVMVGDLVMRGPHSLRVLAMARAVEAEVARGNHEWRLLQWRRLRAKRNVGDVSPIDSRILSSSSLARVACAMTHEDWAQLDAMPLWIHVGGALVVHAGVVPGVDLEEHDERTLMHMRCLDENDNPLEARDSGVLWGTRYTGPPHVLFGHHALADAQLHAWATGLDTGCVYGGSLTALVLDEGEAIPQDATARRRRIRSVPARETYVRIK